MNKRIKKKIEKRDDYRKRCLTGYIVTSAARDWIRRCPAVTEKGSIGSIRYRTYLKSYRIHKRDTELGSSANKTVMTISFIGDAITVQWSPR